MNKAYSKDTDNKITASKNSNAVFCRTESDFKITYTEGKMTIKQYSPIPATYKMKKQICWSRKF